MAGLLDGAISAIAQDFGVSPEAIKQVIRVESNFNPRASTGSYNGLTQIGKQTFTEAGGKLGGMTYGEFLKASPEQQLDAYRGYLEHYDFKGQMAKHGIDVSKMPADQQFAILQGMQFSPNGQQWKAALARGNLNVPVTDTPQARALGTTSLADMAASRFGKGALSVDGSGNVVLAMGKSAPQTAPSLPAYSFTPQAPTATPAAAANPMGALPSILQALTPQQAPAPKPAPLPEPAQFTLLRSLGIPTLF